MVKIFTRYALITVFSLLMISPKLFSQALNGTYVIGTGGNYASFAAAVTALNTYGVSGPVFFNVKNGTYTSRVTINQITGASATNTITFRGESRTGTIFSYSGSSTTDRATVILNGADYITFRNLTIQSISTSYALALYMKSTANYNTVDSCNLIVPSTTSSNIVCFLASAVESGNSTGNNANYTTLSNSTFSGGYYGIDFYGSSSSSWLESNKVSNCLITNQYYYGIYSYYQRDFKIEYCTIKNMGYTSAYGIYKYYNTRSITNGNIIEPGQYGMYQYYENYYTSAQTNTSYTMNNMITNFLNPTYNTGLYLRYNYNSKVYHNSIAVAGSYNTSYPYAAICFYYAYSGNEVKNNILAALLPNGNFCLSNYNPQSTLTVDYNDYYYPGFTSGNLFCAGTSYYSTYSAYKAVTAGFSTNHDANSWNNVNPGFFSNKDLHCAPTTFMDAPVVLPTGYHNDIDNQARATTGTVLIGADLVPANDLDIASLTPQMALLGSNTVTLQLQNTGLNTISASTVLSLAYRVDGGSWVSENLTLSSDLKCGNTVNFSFTTKWNISVDKGYRLTAKIDPQISGDIDVVDSFSQIVYIGMAGNYTINPSGSGSTNFTTFTAAVAQLVARGLAGPVVFNVSANTFTERITIPPILGASATNNVKFIGTTKTTSILQFTGSSTADWATVLMNGADYFTFRDMTIRNLGTSYGIAVLLTNASEYNKFLNCNINVPATTSTSTVVVFAISGSATSATTAGNGGNYNICDSNAFSGGYYGVVAYGAGSSSPSSGNSFRFNTVTNAYVYGMYLYYQGKMFIEYNQVSSFNSPGATTSYGIMNYYGRSVVMNGNSVYGAGYMGFGFAYQNYYFTSDTSYFTNNIVGNMTYTTYHYGVYAYYNYNTHYYHNSISINHSYSTTTSYSGIYAYYNYYSYLKNNIISSTGSSGPCLIRYYGTWYANSIDYNDFYKVGTNFVYWEGTMYANLAALKGADLNQNQNSWSINPQFTSTTNLHLSTNSPVMLAPAIYPTYYDRTAKDVDYEQRNTSGSTFIGADMPPPMTFDSIAVYNIGNPTIFQGQNNAKMIQAKVHFKGFANPLSITSMYFTTNGTTDPTDISKIHFYRQDGTPLDVTYEVGNTTTVTGKITLTFPANYTIADVQSVYVSYDINNNAKIGDTLVCTFDSAMIGGTMQYPSKNTAGYSIIVHPANYNYYCDVTRGTAGAYSIGIKRVRFQNIDNSTPTLDAGIAPTNTVVQFYPASIPTLYRKKTYSFTINHGELNAQAVAIYIDLNNDAYFQTNERVKLYQNVAEASVTTDNLYIDCTVPAGYHRVRLSSDFGSLVPPGCGVSTYGEVEDYLILVGNEEKPVVNCSYKDTAFVKEMVEFTPSTQLDGDLVYYWDWDASGTNEDTTAGKAEYAYQTTGTKAFKLTAELRGCTDTFTSNTITKVITIITPTGKPNVNFLTNLNTITPGMTINFFDLTTNGPFAWKWTITPDSVLGKKAYTFIPNNTTREPQVTFHETGLYTVKLVVENVNGKDSVIKTDYIEVVKDMKMCVDNSSMLRSGYLYDDGGKANYSNPPVGLTSRTCGFLIKPRCAAQINFDFLDFDVNSMIIGTCATLPADAVRIYDGKDNNGIPLHAQFKDNNNVVLYPNGFTNGNGNVNIGLPPSVTASSGSMYVEFYVNCAGVNQGFEGKWTTTLKSFSQPTAGISAPDTAFVDQLVKMYSTSVGTQLEYEWDVDGNGWGDLLDSNITYKYSTAGTYTIRLIVNSCDKLDTTYKKIVVMMPSTTPIVNFEANYLKVTPNDEVTIIDKSDKSVHTWKWSISPADFVYINSSENSQDIKVKFTQTGIYSVKLIATNAKGTDSLTKVNYINVFTPCNPLVAMLNADIGISSVTFTNVNNDTLLHQTSSIGMSAYTDYSNIHRVNVAKGGKYQMYIGRNTNYNTTTISVFLDLNQNGSFTDPGEEVKIFSNSNALQWSFNLPILNTYPNGLVRMRIAATVGQLSNKGCGPNVSGEFEDYMLIISNDYNKPVITLTGGSKITMNSCANFVDPGYSAWDEETGDLTSSVIVTGTINNTVAGTYYKKYNVTDPSGNKATEVIREVEVLADIVKPIAELKGKNPDSVAVYTSYTDPGYIPTDNCSGVKSHKINNNVNTNFVGWQKNMFIVTDNAGNVDTSYRNVYVYDKVAPTIQLIGKDTMYVDVFNNFVDPGAQPSDNYDTKVSYTVNSNLNTNELGTYILTYCVTDSSGNGPTCVDRIVIVRDKSAPTITLKGSTTMTIDVFTQFNDPGYDVTDNYYELAKGQIIVYVSGFVNTTKLGSYSITYKAVDGSGNISGTLTRIVNVVDRVAPTIQLLGQSIIVVERWQNFVDPGVNVMDNYYKASELVIDYNKNGSYPGNTLEEGIYTYSYKVCDPSNNCSEEIYRTINVVKSTSSIADADKLNFNLYPNPASDYVTVSIEFPSYTNVNMAVYNALGEKVIDIINGFIISDTRKIDVSNLSSGVYYLRVNTGENTPVNKKFIIAR